MSNPRLALLVRRAGIPFATGALVVLAGAGSAATQSLGGRTGSVAIREPIAAAEPLAVASKTVCPGDCNEDGRVEIAELLTSVAIALGNLAAVRDCPNADPDADGAVAITEIVRAVKSALYGCALPASTPTATHPATATVAATATSTDTASPTATASATPTCPFGLELARTTQPTNSIPGRPPMPTPGPQYLLHLLGDSRVFLPDGTAEPIAGSMLMSSCFSPNTFFTGRVEALLLTSDSVTIEGGCSAIGHIVGSTLYGGSRPVSFSSQVFVNGEPLRMSGDGPFDFSTYLVLLDLVSGTYRLHLVAEVGDDSGTGTAPSCFDWGFG